MTKEQFLADVIKLQSLYTRAPDSEVAKHNLSAACNQFTTTYGLGTDVVGKIANGAASLEELFKLYDEIKFVHNGGKKPDAE